MRYARGPALRPDEEGIKTAPTMTDAARGSSGLETQL